ncbi:MAG: HAD family hydrolase [Lachnotalea sp.]
MNKQYILFDLDGTLTDPKIGITKSVCYALEKFGIVVDDSDSLNRFIGPPLVDSFIEFYGFDLEKANLAVEKYREYFAERGLYENYVYDGIESLLSTLKSNHKMLIVATSKPIVFAIKILEHYHLLEYFDFVAGSELDGTRVEKVDVISYAMKQCNITDNESVIMVGDRKHDIIGANKVGIESIGVLYGYGSQEEFELAGANYIVSNITELEALLLK